MKAATGGDWLGGVWLLLVNWVENDAGCQVNWGLCPPGERGMMGSSAGLAGEPKMCFFSPGDAG